MFSAPAEAPDAASPDAEPAAITSLPAAGAAPCFCMKGQGYTLSRAKRGIKQFGKANPVTTNAEDQ